VTSVLILPGNKYIVMGTKEGSILLYDLSANELIQEIEAHTKEVWELAMHTNP
jgi:U3 small nucleolar RNA-associated protein 12